MGFIIEWKRWGFFLGAVLIFGSSRSVPAQMSMQLPAEMSTQNFTSSLKLNTDNLQFDFSSSGSTTGSTGTTSTSGLNIPSTSTSTLSPSISGSQLNLPAIRDLNPLSLMRPRVVGCDGSLGSAPAAAEVSAQTGRCAAGYVRAEKIGIDESRTESCLSCGVSKRLCRNGLSQWVCVERSQ